MTAAAAFGSAAQAQSVQEDGNRPRLVVTPSVRTIYDSNVLRYNDDADGPRDNVRVTAGVDVLVRRTFGRTALNVAGTVGYDFNSRFKFLNRTRIELAGGARTPVGAICQVALDASYYQFQFDLGDVDRIVGATTRLQTYDLGVSCNRAAGFSPLAGVTYTDRSSGSSGLFSSNTLGARAGVSYAKPSLGVLTLSASRARIRRPGVRDLLGNDDGTNITQVSLGLSRNVAPRFGFSAGFGYVTANPKRAGVSAFSGLSFNGEATWRPKPRFVVTGSADRQVTSQNGINATYVIRDNYQLGVSYQLSRASRFRVSAVHVNRDFRGREALPLATGIGRDSTDILTGSYSYDAARLLRYTFSVSQRWRDADVSRFDYKSTVAAVGIGAKF